MKDEKVILQSLRVPTGWNISINNFYDIEPSNAGLEYYYSSVLISGDSNLMGLSFDSRYEPEGQLGGDFVLVLQRNNYDKKGKIKSAEVLGIIKTKSKNKFIEMLEKFMEEGRL